MVQKLSSAGGSSERITKWLEDQLKAIESGRSNLQSSRRELEMERDKLATFSIEAKQLKQSLRECLIGLKNLIQMSDEGYLDKWSKRLQYLRTIKLRLGGEYLVNPADAGLTSIRSGVTSGD